MRQKTGFSLAEITVALAILALSVILVAAAFPVGMDQHRRMTEASLARTIANNAEALLQTRIDADTFSLDPNPVFQPIPLHNFQIGADGAWVADSGDYWVGDNELNKSAGFDISLLDRVYPRPSAPEFTSTNIRFNHAKLSRYAWCGLWRARGTGLAPEKYRDAMVMVTRKMEKHHAFPSSSGVADDDLAQPTPRLITVTGVIAGSANVTVSPANQLIEDGYLIDATYGEVYRIRALEPADQVILDRAVADHAPLPAPFSAGGYTVPALRGIDDQPVIGVFRFSLMYE